MTHVRKTDRRTVSYNDQLLVSQEAFNISTNCYLMRKVSCQKYNFLKENSSSSMHYIPWADFRLPSAKPAQENRLSAQHLRWFFSVKISSAGTDLSQSHQREDWEVLTCLWCVARLGLQTWYFGIIIYNYQRAVRIHEVRNTAPYSAADNKLERLQ